MRRFLILIAFLISFFAVGAYAAPTTTYHRNIFPEITSTYEVGTSTRSFIQITTDGLCLTGDTCRTTWPTGGSGASADWIVSSTFGNKNVITPSTTIGVWSKTILAASSSLYVEGDFYSTLDGLTFYDKNNNTLLVFNDSGTISNTTSTNGKTATTLLSIVSILDSTANVTESQIGMTFDFDHLSGAHTISAESGGIRGRCVEGVGVILDCWGVAGLLESDLGTISGAAVSGQLILTGGIMASGSAFNARPTDRVAGTLSRSYAFRSQMNETGNNNWIFFDDSGNVNTHSSLNVLQIGTSTFAGNVAGLLVQATSTVGVPLMVRDDSGLVMAQLASTTMMGVLVDTNAENFAGNYARLRLGTLNGRAGALEVKASSNEDGIITVYNYTNSGNVATQIASGAILFGTGSTTGTLKANQLILGKSTSFLEGNFNVDISGNTSASGSLKVYGNSDCSNVTTGKLLYTALTGLFSCGTDQTGGGSFDGRLASPNIFQVTDGTTTSTLTANTLSISTSSVNNLGLFFVDSSGNTSVSGTLQVFADNSDPVITVQSSSTDTNRPARVGIGTTTHWRADAGLRHQLTVGGSIDSEARYLACDAPASGLTLSVGSTQGSDIVGLCSGDFAFDSNASGNISAQNKPYGAARLAIAGLAASGSALRTNQRITSVTSTPIIEAFLEIATPAGGQQSYVFGLINMDFGMFPSSTPPSDGVYFVASTTANWIAVVRSNNVETGTFIDTGVPTSTPARLSIWPTADSVLFIADGGVVAEITDNIPVTNLAAYAGISRESGVALSVMLVSGYRVWTFKN